MLSIHDTYTPDYRLDPPKPKRHCLRCSNCGEGIQEGDDYYEIRGEQYCTECIKEDKRIAQHCED